MTEVDANWRYCGLKVVRLENDFMRLDVLPEADGKIYNLVHKPSGRNVLCHNPRVPPARHGFGACYDDNWSGDRDKLIPNDIPCAAPAGDLFRDHGEAWLQSGVGRLGVSEGRAVGFHPARAAAGEQVH
jgi:hypothetical protein